MIGGILIPAIAWYLAVGCLIGAVKPGLLVFGSPPWLLRPGNCRGVRGYSAVAVMIAMWPIFVVRALLRLKDSNLD